MRPRDSDPRSPEQVAWCRHLAEHGGILFVHHARSGNLLARFTSGAQGPALVPAALLTMIEQEPSETLTEIRNERLRGAERRAPGPEFSVAEYARLMDERREHPCTPEEQSGDAAGVRASPNDAAPVHARADGLSGGAGRWLRIHSRAAAHHGSAEGSAARLALVGL